MSNINVWLTTNDASEEDQTQSPALAKDNASIYAGGEELMAVHKIVSLLDRLNDGEVIVISRELF